MEIRFRVRYEFKPTYDSPCVAVVSLILPPGEAWVDPEVEVWGEPLRPPAGIFRRKGKRIVREFRAESWELLEKQVTEAIQRAASVLGWVIKDNLRRMRSVPAEKEFTFVIEDGDVQGRKAL